MCGWQEAVVLPPWLFLAVRSQPGQWQYLRCSSDPSLALEDVPVAEYLRSKEQLVASE